jgi:phospholipase/carboxylesterase
VSAANKGIPINIYHGTRDPMVPESLGRTSVQKLEQLGFSPSYKTFPMEHSVCLEEVQEIGQFIRSRVL